MADPITIGVLTSAVTSLATKAAEGAAGEAGKELWEKIKGLFGWMVEPDPAELPAKVAGELVARPELQAKVAETIKSAPTTDVSSQMIVHAEKIGVMNNYGTIHQSF